MSNEYEKRTMAARKQADRWTYKTIKRTQEIIESSIDELNRSLLDRKPGSLSERWAKEYIKALEKEYARITYEITKVMVEGIRGGARAGTAFNREFLGEVFKDSGLILDSSFKSMFANIEDSVVRRIVEGGFYVDNKTLSDRIWNFTDEFGRSIQDVISQGLMQQKSAVNMAKDLRTFVKPPEKRPLSWRGDYESYKAYHANWQAMRLARTTINHAHQNATIASCQNNPFIDSVQWLTSGHSNVCPDCQDREGKIYRLNEVPVDHPNGRCALAPVVDRDMRDIGREIGEWLAGGENEKLDSWYEKIKSFEDKDKGYSYSGVEMLALNRYISSDSYKINEKLRNGDLLEQDDEEFIENLDSALRNTPKYQGDLIRDLYFMFEDYKYDFIEKHTEGAIIEYKEYISTTKSLSGYHDIPSVRIKILDSVNGRDISKINENEAEVLYERNSKFKVIKVVEDEVSTYIFLKEVEGER